MTNLTKARKRLSDLEWMSRHPELTLKEMAAHLGVSYELAREMCLRYGIGFKRRYRSLMRKRGDILGGNRRGGIILPKPGDKAATGGGRDLETILEQTT